MRETDMDHVNDFRKLVEDNLDSYELKVESITRFMQEAAKLVERISDEQEQLALRLRDVLAKSQCLRKKDFDILYCPAKKLRQRELKKVTKAIEDFRRGEYQMIDRWKGLISLKEALNMADFQVIKEKMLMEHDRREREVVKTLRNFHLQQEELLMGLKGLVDKGELVRISDLKGMLRNLESRAIERETEMGQLLEEIRDAAQVVREDWDMMTIARGFES